MGRLRALNGAIACENITSEHIDPFEGVVVSHAAHEPFIHLCEAPPSTLLPLFLKLTCHSTAPRSDIYEALVRCSRKCTVQAQAMSSEWRARNKAACAQGLWSPDHGSTSSRLRSVKDVATTSTRESVMLRDIVRHLRRPSTLKHEQDNSSMACVGETGEAPRGRNDERRRSWLQGSKGVHLFGRR